MAMLLSHSVQLLNLILVILALQFNFQLVLRSLLHLSETVVDLPQLVLRTAFSE